MQEDVLRGPSCRLGLSAESSPQKTALLWPLLFAIHGAVSAPYSFPCFLAPALPIFGWI